jgi:hypothetical protein
MPELSDTGADMIYRNTCVESYFKTWIYLVKKIIYDDDLRPLRLCPWEPQSYHDAKNHEIYVPPKIDLIQNRFNWPCFVTDDSLPEFCFQLKYLWEIHCNNDLNH